MSLRLKRVLLAVAIAAAPWWAAGEDAPPHAPVPWLDWLAEEMSFALAAATEPDTAAADPAENAPAPPAGSTEEELARLRNEVREVRSEMRHLRATLDYYMEGIVAKTQEENAQLRAELQRVYALQRAAPEAVFPAVPRPNDELVAEVLSQTVEDMLEDSAAGQSPAEDTAAAPEPFRYDVISEWGREPDQEEVLSGETTSLKGMVCLVPARSRKEDVVQLGRDLRAQFEAYDNINIEIFDEEAAARSFAETSISTGPQHRVLSISKHKASGRDTMVYFEDGAAKEIPKE